jgi:hypothetical protein
MRATGWNNGRPTFAGSGYGLRIAKADRERFFATNWSSVTLEMGNQCIVVSLSKSFWDGCSELRSKSIGRWLLDQQLAPWPAGEPPVVEIVPTDGAHFRLELSSSAVSGCPSAR